VCDLVFWNRLQKRITFARSREHAGISAYWPQPMVAAANRNEIGSRVARCILRETFGTRQVEK
jgi:hypothetical protein